ncbi:MAG TPA: hypothetical protein VFK52_00570 [Nocardioidaceae bacterium]|nr:hypothetical protein [Nocardioidaceae bacterium]
MPDLRPSSWLSRLIQALAPPAPRNLVARGEDYPRFVELTARLREQSS